MIQLEEIDLEISKLESEYQFYNGMQAAFKVCINSYYGYMGTGSMTFSDLHAAKTVTSIGRMIVNDMAEQLECQDCKVIEIDTDGIFFSKGKCDSIDFMLPDGINVDVDDPVDWMVSVKAKNYVLVEGEKYTYHGNSLRSRRDEGFGINFLKEIVDCLINDECDEIYEIYHKYQNNIIYSRLPVEELCKRERITDKINTTAKRRLKEAVEQTELKEGEYIKVYQKKDGSLAPIEQFENDIDRFYYLERLHKFAERISELLANYGIELNRIDKRTFNKLYQSACI